MRKTLLGMITVLNMLSYNLNKAQSIETEKISFQILQAPKIIVEAQNRSFNVKVTSPYNLTAEDVIKKSKEEFEARIANYHNEVAESKIKFQERVRNYDLDVKKAREKYDLEVEAFKKLNVIERLTLTDKGQQPKLELPSKPEYHKPYPPSYSQPNLNDYFIVDNNVIASQIKVDGYTKGNAYVDISIDIKPVNFQDNAGQTYANQPTKLTIKVNNIEKVNESLFNDYEFVSSSSSDNINKVSEEKTILQRTISGLNKKINEYFGYQKNTKNVYVDYVKNKGNYNDLEKAHIYVTTNLKKLQGNPDSNSSEVALTNMQKGFEIWTNTLKNINYQDPKAEFNYKIAKYIYYNFIRINLAFDNKKEAEKYLNEFQENMVYMKLDSDEKRQLDSLEKQIYK